MNKEELNRAAEKNNFEKELADIFWECEIYNSKGKLVEFMGTKAGFMLFNSALTLFKSNSQARDSQPLPDMKELRERFRLFCVEENKYHTAKEFTGEMAGEIFNWFEREFKGVVEKESVEFHKWAYRQGWNYIDGEWVNVSLSKSSEELYQLYLQSKTKDVPPPQK